MNVNKLIMVGLIMSTTSCSVLGRGPVSPQQHKIDLEILSEHNKYRAKHHAPKLIWDDRLAAYAERYGSNCKFKHSYGPYGENLAAGFSTVSASVARWYNEKSIYSYSHPGFSKATGHFTQLVWKSTTRLGCGYVSCDGKNGTPGKYLVCEYSPAGNVVNEGFFEENVLPA
jgi:uncharacterized protein YkwD